jgi:hypothetical protein
MSAPPDIPKGQWTDNTAMAKLVGSYRIDIDKIARESTENLDQDSVPCTKVYFQMNTGLSSSPDSYRLVYFVLRKPPDSATYYKLIPNDSILVDNMLQGALSEGSLSSPFYPSGQDLDTIIGDSENSQSGDECVQLNIEPDTNNANEADSFFPGDRFIIDAYVDSVSSGTLIASTPTMTAWKNIKAWVDAFPSVTDTDSVVIAYAHAESIAMGEFAPNGQWYNACTYLDLDPRLRLWDWGGVPSCMQLDTDFDSLSQAIGQVVTDRYERLLLNQNQWPAYLGVYGGMWSKVGGWPTKWKESDTILAATLTYDYPFAASYVFADSIHAYCTRIGQSPMVGLAVTIAHELIGLQVSCLSEHIPGTGCVMDRELNADSNMTTPHFCPDCVYQIRKTSQVELVQ